MTAGVRDASDRGLVRALVLSIVAAAIPVSGAFLFPEHLRDYEALTWLLLLVPAFLWAYERGWRGIATALAFGMAAVTVTYVTTELGGREVPDLLLAVVAAYIAITLGIGLFGAGVARGGFSGDAAGRSLLDGGTGLPSRAQADLHLELEFAAARKGRPLTVVLFDIDGFSEYTARYGRGAADGVLRGFATIVQQHTRRMDVGARYGEASFLSVLSGALAEGAMIFATRLLERMRTAESNVTLPTVSAGIATYRPEMTEPAELLREAQEALAQAKRDGGDRVRVFGRLIAADGELRDAEVASGAAAVRMDATVEDSVGRGRSAFLLTSDREARARLGGFLKSQGFQLIEGTALLDALVPLQGDFDLVFVDVAPHAQAVADLVRGIRTRSPTTRVIGIPPTVDGGALPVEVLDIRVDAHYLPNVEAEALRRQTQELLAERDALESSLLRHRQLSDEIRAIDREGRAALEASEAKYRNVVETIQEVIFTTDANGVLTFLNPAWTEITGFAIDESVGRPIQDFLVPEDGNALLAELAITLEAAGTSIRHEGRWRTRNRDERWIELRMQLDVGADGLLGTSGVLADITERRAAEEALRKSEEYFRSLIENSSDVMAVLNADGTVRYVSPAIGRVLGRPPIEWIGATPFTADADGSGTQRRAFEEALSRPGGTQTTQARAQHADGSWRQLEITWRNLLEVPGVEGVVINARDVTERHESERALRESTELLLRAQKMEAIGRLAGGVAHDFNNLLTAIQGHADLLLGDLEPGGAIREDLTEIRDAAERATSLTRQLLAFSRRQVMQPRVLDVNDVVRSMERMLSRVVGEDIALIAELDADAGCVRADPAQLEQVLLNLIVNARDSMPDGGSTIVSSGRRVFERTDALPADLPFGEYVVLTVTDSGAGMAPEVAAHAFEPFYTTKAAGQGTGLGLASVYGIVKQSGGHVWIESRPGSGTVITILLPRVEERAESSPPRPAPTYGDAGGSETILLVEDEKSVRDLAVRILERRGYNVIVAADGREAVDAAQREHQTIDLLLTDVIMPGLNGQDVAERVRALRPDIRVLFMSGYNEEAVLRDGVLAAGSAFIEKPFSPAVLLERVRSILGEPVSNDTAPEGPAM